MKTSVMCSLIAVAAMGTGIGIGWMLRGERMETRTPSRIARTSHSPTAPGGKRAADSGQNAREETAVLVAEELEKMKTMSVTEFAGHMADAWLTDSANPDRHLRRALYLSACDADRGVAFWMEYTRRLGVNPNDDQKLPGFFNVVAYRDGKRFAEKLAEACPGQPLIQVAAGWAAAAPKDAMEWFNALPESSPQYDSSLQGILWGLAEHSPATALYVYEQLKPGDQNYNNAFNLALSTMRNHGMQGLNEVVAGVKNEAEKQLLLTSAISYTTKEQPPGEFVKWMAEPLESAPYLRGNFEQMASRWAANAPEEAMAWLQQNALSANQGTALSLVAASLARNGKRDNLAAWLDANPNAPGRAAIVSGKAGPPAP